MKNKIFVTLLFGASIICSNSNAMPSGNPYFYIEANKAPNIYDIRVPGLVMTGLYIAIASAIYKLDAENRAEFCKKNNISSTKEAIFNFCKKIVPSASSVLLIGGLLLMASSKNIIHFFDACFKCWALDQMHIYEDSGVNEINFDKLVTASIEKSLS